jgi:hypothetical protein
MAKRRIPTRRRHVNWGPAASVDHPAISLRSAAPAEIALVARILAKVSIAATHPS